jgi:hypothetical protein
MLEVKNDIQNPKQVCGRAKLNEHGADISSTVMIDFGSDKKESSSRMVLSLEQNYKLNNDLDLNINYGRSYNFEKNKSFMLDIKQDSKFSDHLTEISFSYKNNEIN